MAVANDADTLQEDSHTQPNLNALAAVTCHIHSLTTSKSAKVAEEGPLSVRVVSGLCQKIALSWLNPSFQSAGTTQLEDARSSIVERTCMEPKRRNLQIGGKMSFGPALPF